MVFRLAKANGTIDLWLTLSIQYDTSVPTAEAMAAQQIDVARRFQEILDPLVRQKKVLGVGPVQGPSCEVKVTAAGLRALFRNQQILQFVEIHNREN